MPAKIRRLPSDLVRLRPPVLGLVRQLAHLAGVSVPEIVEHVLMEVLHDDAPDVPPTAPLPPPPPPRREARVVPIARARARRLPTQHVVPQDLDLAGLRRRAGEICARSEAARRRAQSARMSAAAARDRASRALSMPGS
jgi:hypothetical protein